MIIHNLKYKDFLNCLSDFDFISTNNEKYTGMSMYYLPNDHPCINFKFDHKNKRKAWKQLNELCKMDVKLQTQYFQGVFYTFVNKYIK